LLKPSKKIVGIILIIGILVGIPIGVVLSNGSNPTIDEEEGISNFPWLNASVGIGAPEFYRGIQNYTEFLESLIGEGGVSDHGALTGLLDDDHPIYLLEDGSEKSGIDANWLKLGEINRTTWPSGGEIGNYQMSVSILINQTGNTHYAINGSTGQTDYGGPSDAGGVDGASASAVLQAALDDVRDAGGGKVFLKNGNYSLSTNLKVGNNTILEGESWNTILTGPTDLTTWTCIIENERVRTVYANSFITIRNLQIDGQKDSINPSATRPGGIGFTGVQNVIIENNYIHDVVLFCVRLSQWTSDGAINRDVIIRNNFFENADFNGLMAEAENPGDTSRILVEGNYVTGTDTGLSCYKASFVSYVNNICWNNTNNRLFTNFIDIATEQESTDILIAGNICMGSGPYTEGGGGQNVNGIEVVHSTCDRVLIANNYVKDKTYSAINANNNCSVIGNRIYNSPAISGSYAIISGRFTTDNIIGGLWKCAIVAGDGSYIAHNQALDIHYSGYGVIRVIGDGNYIEDNYIYDTTPTEAMYGIYLLSGADDNRVIGNKFINLYRAINIDGGDGTIIIENDFTGCTTEIYGSETNTIIKRNIGYVTENSGTQTCADNENIVHGLDLIPTFIGVTPMNDTYDGVPVIATVDWSGVDSTNIRVGLYWLNGTAITTDIILVSWSATYEP
jgi:hypothetical protein